MTVALRAGVFILLAWVGMIVFPWLMYPVAGLLITSTLSTFAAGAVANTITVRIFERGVLADIGLDWRKSSARELLAGLAMGASAAALMLAVPLVLGLAHFKTAEPAEHPIPAFLFVTAALLFGAVGEELLFRGYAFQLLVRKMGAWATIVPVAVIFGLV